MVSRWQAKSSFNFPSVSRCCLPARTISSYVHHTEYIWGYAILCVIMVLLSIWQQHPNRLRSCSYWGVVDPAYRVFHVSDPLSFLARNDMNEHERWVCDAIRVTQYSQCTVHTNEMKRKRSRSVNSRWQFRFLPTLA